MMLVLESCGEHPGVVYVAAGYETYSFSCAPALRRHFSAIGKLVARDETAAASIAILD